MVIELLKISEMGSLSVAGVAMIHQEGLPPKKCLVL